jgi:hypothetical protein
MVRREPPRPESIMGAIVILERSFPVRVFRFRRRREWNPRKTWKTRMGWSLHLASVVKGLREIAGSVQSQTNMAAASHKRRSA